MILGSLVSKLVMHDRGNIQRKHPTTTGMSPNTDFNLHGGWQASKKETLPIFELL